jgi:oligopeptide transport system substrate-binding protein
MRHTSIRLISIVLALALFAGLAACKSAPVQINDLNISPPKITIGQNSNISASLYNPNKGEEKYSATLKVNDTTVETKDIILAGGEKKTVDFSYSASSTGTFKIDLNGLIDNLSVLKPPEFEVTSLDISPAEIVSESSITVNAEVKNIGEIEGIYTAKLNIDGVEISTKDIKVGTESPQKAEFTTKLNSSGNHTIEIGGISKTITALRPAELLVNSVKVTPNIVFPGQDANVVALVTNTGEVKGSLPVSITINGLETDSKDVLIEPGKTDNVAFTVSRDTVGDFELGVKERKAILKIIETKSYTSPKYYYSISYPSGWTLKDEEPESISLEVSNDIYAGITALILPVVMSQQYFADQIISYNTKQLPQFKVISTDTIQLSNDITAVKFIYTYNRFGVFVKGSCVLVKQGRFAYFIECVTLEAAWDQKKDLVDAFLNSFISPTVITGFYSDSNIGYSITLPFNWDAVANGKQGTLLQYQNEYNATPISGWLIHDNTGTASLSEYTESIASQFQKLPGYKIKTQGEVALSNSSTGYEIVCSYSQNGVPLTTRINTLFHGSQAFSFITSTPTSNYSLVLDSTNNLLNSFKFTEPKPYGVSRQDSLFLSAGEIVTLDPALTEDSPGDIIGAIFSGLVKYNQDLQVFPDLAEKWDVSSDNTTYTFYLRKNATFHNGKTVTAQDVKYSWERALDPNTKSPKSSTYLGDILGAQDILSGKSKELTGVKIIDANTLQVTIDGPKPYFLGKLAQACAFIVDKANATNGANWYNQANGTGPFKIMQWDKGELLILERNDNFYSGPAKLKNIVFKIFAGRPMMMYENGEIDTTGVYLDDLDKVTDPSNPLNKELISLGHNLSTQYTGFNVTKAPFDDPKVRQAFGQALDMDKLIEVSLKGNAQRAAGVLPPGMPGSNPDLKPLSFDPAQAKQLISESKYGSFDKLPAVSMSVLYGASPVEEAMVAMWKQNLGIDVKVEVIKELKEWETKRHDRSFQLFVSGWGADYLDPQNFLDILFQSQSQENQCAYSNPAVDSALKEAAVEQDSSLRLKKYQDIEKIILNDFAVIPFCNNYKDNQLIKPYVNGLRLFPMGINIWAEISIIAH